MGKVLFLLWFTALCSIVACQGQPEDLQKIVDSVRKELNRHLREINDGTAAPSTESPVNSESPNPLFRNRTKYEQALLESFNRSRGFDVPRNRSSSIVRCKRMEHGDVPCKTSNDESETDKLHESSDAVSSTVLLDSPYELSMSSFRIKLDSAKGAPGVNFPDYTDIPETSFTCSDKAYRPGFYADLDAGCQVFHVCWADRRETFLCPMGTIFNQALLVCDFWYSTNCSMAPSYYSVNAESGYPETKSKEESLDLFEQGSIQSSSEAPVSPESVLKPPISVSAFISQFLPVKAKVVIYPGIAGEDSKVVAYASVGEERRREHSKVSSRRRIKGSERKMRTSVHLDIPLSDEPVRPAYDEGMHEMDKISNSVWNNALERMLNDIKYDESITHYYDIADVLVAFLRKYLWGNEIPEYYVPSPDSTWYQYYLIKKDVSDGVVIFAKPVLVYVSMRLDEMLFGPPADRSKMGPSTPKADYFNIHTFSGDFADPLSDEPTNSASRPRMDMDEADKISASLWNEALESLLNDIKYDSSTARFSEIAEIALTLIRKFLWGDEIPEAYVPSPDSAAYQYYLLKKGIPELLLYIVKPFLKQLAVRMDTIPKDSKEYRELVAPLEHPDKWAKWVVGIIKEIEAARSKTPNLKEPKDLESDHDFDMQMKLSGEPFEKDLEDNYEDKMLATVVSEAFQLVLNTVKSDSSVSMFSDTIESFFKLITTSFWGSETPEVYVPTPGCEGYEYYLSKKAIFSKLPFVVKTVLEKMRESLLKGLFNFRQPVKVVTESTTGRIPTFRPPVKVVTESTIGKIPSFRPPAKVRLPPKINPRFVVRPFVPKNQRHIHRLSISTKTKNILLINYMKLLNMKLKHV